MKKILHLGAIVISLLALSGVAHADTTVHIELADVGSDIDFSKKLDLHAGGHGDMKMAPVSLKADATTVPAGKITFEVTNNSKDIQHEMIVSPIASMDDAPPLNAEGIKVDEDASKALGEVPELDPGKTGSATFDMKPGFYILYCNIEGHYDSGMWAKLEVK